MYTKKTTSTSRIQRTCVERIKVQTIRFCWSLWTPSDPLVPTCSPWIWEEYLKDERRSGAPVSKAEFGASVVSQLANLKGSRGTDGTPAASRTWVGGPER